MNLIDHPKYEGVQYIPGNHKPFPVEKAPVANLKVRAAEKAHNSRVRKAANQTRKEVTAALRQVDAAIEEATGNEILGIEPSLRHLDIPFGKCNLRVENSVGALKAIRRRLELIKGPYANVKSDDGCGTLPWQRVEVEVSK